MFDFAIFVGFNDNPTAQQFEAAYRKLLIHNDVVCSKKANVIEPGTKILSVSSNRPKKMQNTNLDEGFDELILDEDFESSFYVAQYIDDAHSHSLAFMASVLEAKIIKSKSPRLIVKCEDCTAAFIENELIEDSFIRFKARSSNITQPCKSTFEICKYVDTFIKSCDKQTVSCQAITLQILRSISYDTLYTATNFDKHGDMGHKYNFIKKIVELYMRMKSTYVAKCFTLKTHANPIRHEFRKIIQQKGQ